MLFRSPDDSAPIPHPVATINLLIGRPPWRAGTLMEVDSAWADWLRRFCRGGPTTLIVADMAALPDAMRGAGFRGRDNALWYTLSRSYAEWNWSSDGTDPDAHLSHQRRELHDCWSGYLDAVERAMEQAPGTRALILLHDGPDRCGDVLSEYSLRQLHAVAVRCDRGEVHR